jgi:hypothetical protein
MVLLNVWVMIRMIMNLTYTSIEKGKPSAHVDKHQVNQLLNVPSGGKHNSNNSIPSLIKVANRLISKGSEANPSNLSPQQDW